MFDLSFSSSASLGATATTGISRVDQRQRAVLELAGRIGLGVDVRDLLELQRAFQRDRVVQAAAEEQRVLLAARSARAQRDDLRLERQHALQRRRAGGAAPRGSCASSLGVRRPRSLRERQRQQEQRDELRGERLGRGDADLGAGAREVRQLASARTIALVGDVADRQRVLVAERLARASARPACRRFRPTARSSTTSAFGLRHAVAIAVFAGDLDRARHPGERLDPVLARRGPRSSWCRRRGSAPSRRPAGSSAAWRRTAPARSPRRLRACRRPRAAARRSPSACSAGTGRARPRRCRPALRRRCASHALAGRVEDRVRLAPQVGDVAFLEVDDAPRDRHSADASEARKFSCVADADEQRAALRARR